MTADTDFFISRAEIDYLRTKLETVASLEAEMAIALTGQSRMNDGPTTSRPKPHSKPPYPIHLEDEIAELRNELTTVARDICETRGLIYDGGGSCAGVAKWLVRYRIALAMMPQAVDLFHGLCKQIDHCARMMNQHEEEYVLDRAMYERANRQVMTGVQIGKLAYKLGEQGKGLTRKRIDSLRERHDLPFTQDPETGVYFYRLGDVIEWHRAAKQYRTRKTA